jgi:hypothetical protein
MGTSVRFLVALSKALLAISLVSLAVVTIAICFTQAFTGMAVLGFILIPLLLYWTARGALILFGSLVSDPVMGGEREYLHATSLLWLPSSSATSTNQLPLLPTGGCKRQ